METAQKIAIRILELDPNWVQDRIWLDSHKIVEAMKAYAMQECEKVRQSDMLKLKSMAFNDEELGKSYVSIEAIDHVLSTPITLS